MPAVARRGRADGRNDHSHEAGPAFSYGRSVSQEGIGIRGGGLGRQGSGTGRGPHSGQLRALEYSPWETKSLRFVTARLLLDTHVVVRWLAAPKKLSQDQLRALRSAVRRGEPLALSAITLLEIAVLFGEGGTRLRVPIRDLFAALDPGAGFSILPFDVETAAEVAVLGDALRDPANRAIVATARVHRLRLVTSDQRIINSNLVPLIE